MAQAETEPTKAQLEHAKRFLNRVGQYRRLLEAREQKSQSPVKTAPTKPGTKCVD